VKRRRDLCGGLTRPGVGVDRGDAEGVMVSGGQGGLGPRLLPGGRTEASSAPSARPSTAIPPTAQAPRRGSDVGTGELAAYRGPGRLGLSLRYPGVFSALRALGENRAQSPPPIVRGAPPPGCPGPKTGHEGHAGSPPLMSIRRREFRRSFSRMSSLHVGEGV
jgi:hypothetical protein